MAKTREVKQAQIFFGATNAEDRIRVSYVIKDSDEETRVGVDKDLNVGAQLRADIQALLDQIIVKLDTETKLHTRPLENPF